MYVQYGGVSQPVFSRVMWLLLSRKQSYFLWILYYLSSVVITAMKKDSLNKHLYCCNYCFDILSRSVFLNFKYFRFICCRAMCLKVLRIEINFSRGYAEWVRLCNVFVVTDRHRRSLYSLYGFHSEPYIFWKQIHFIIEKK